MSVGRYFVVEKEWSWGQKGSTDGVLKEWGCCMGVMPGAGYVACCQFSLVDRDELDVFDGWVYDLWVAGGGTASVTPRGRSWRLGLNFSWPTRWMRAWRMSGQTHRPNGGRSNKMETQITEMRENEGGMRKSEWVREVLSPGMQGITGT